MLAESTRLLWVQTVLAADLMGYQCDIGPRDSEPMTMIHMDEHQGPAPLEHVAGSHEPATACPGSGQG